MSSNNPPFDPLHPLPSDRPIRRTSDANAFALSRGYGDALCSADADGAARIVEQALNDGLEPAAVHALVIMPAMERIGELWESNELSIADEHLATAISQQVLVRLFAALSTARPRSRERVLLAAVEGQQHVLGLRMIADVLEGAGFDVLYLGADTPVEALRIFAADHQPAVTGLGFGIALNVDLLAESVFAIHEAAPESRLMFGGRAAPPDLSAVGYPWVRDSLDVIPTVERLLTEPPKPVSPFFEAMRPVASASSRPRSEGETQVAIEAQLAGVVEDASEAAREYVRRAGEFRDLARRDQVTGLANRRAFDDRIRSMSETSRDHGALLLIDVDAFKSVNDTLGHDSGDQLLRRVGKAISDAIRPSDFGARVGGDEFAVLLPATTPATGSEIGERIRAEVERIKEPAATVSIGVAALESDPRAAMMSADGALYAAKAAGRNRVFTADGSSRTDQVEAAETAPGPEMYVSMSRLTVPVERAAELIEAFRSRARLVERADGFVDLQVWQSDRDAGEILMVSRWRDREAFKAYMKSGDHKSSHDRVAPDLKADVKLQALEHLHTYRVVAE